MRLQLYRSMPLFLYVRALIFIDFYMRNKQSIYYNYCRVADVTVKRVNKTEEKNYKTRDEIRVSGV